MTYRPVFRPQNPAYSGDPEGWNSCTAYSASMAGDYDTLGAKKPLGKQIRALTHDHTGGLNLAQVDAALLQGWDINLNTTYRLPWATFAAAIRSGKGGILQGWYAPIADSRFDAGRGFRGNHAVFVLPGFIAMDPLADGRPGAYRYHAEPYPESLLKSFAGKLNIGGSAYRALGSGLVYCALTRDKTADWQVVVKPNTSYTRHQVVNGIARMDLRKVYRTVTGLHLPCTPPQSYPTNRGTRIGLVQITKPGSNMDGWFLSSGYAQPKEA